MNRRGTCRTGFTLIELVVVVVIIAIIAAVAIPKMSRGSAGAGDAALSQNLATIRSALDMYQTEHGGAPPSNASADTFVKQLTQYTDASGNALATKDATHVYGPYLKSFPPLPVGTNKGLTAVTVTAGSGSQTSAGWYFDGSTVWANDPATDTDVSGTAYNTY